MDTAEDISRRLLGLPPKPKEGEGDAVAEANPAPPTKPLTAFEREAQRRAERPAAPFPTGEPAGDSRASGAVPSSKYTPYPRRVSASDQRQLEVARAETLSKQGYEPETVREKAVTFAKEAKAGIEQMGTGSVAQLVDPEATHRWLSKVGERYPNVARNLALLLPPVQTWAREMPEALMTGTGGAATWSTAKNAFDLLGRFGTDSIGSEIIRQVPEGEEAWGIPKALLKGAADLLLSGNPAVQAYRWATGTASETEKKLATPEALKSLMQGTSSLDADVRQKISTGLRENPLTTLPAKAAEAVGLPNLPGWVVGGTLAIVSPDLTDLAMAGAGKAVKAAKAASMAARMRKYGDAAETALKMLDEGASYQNIDKFLATQGQAFQSVLIRPTAAAVAESGDVLARKADTIHKLGLQALEDAKKLEDEVAAKAQDAQRAGQQADEALAQGAQGSLEQRTLEKHLEAADAFYAAAKADVAAKQEVLTAYGELLADAGAKPGTKAVQQELHDAVRLHQQELEVLEVLQKGEVQVPAGDLSKLEKARAARESAQRQLDEVLQTKPNAKKEASLRKTIVKLDERLAQLERKADVPLGKAAGERRAALQKQRRVVDKAARQVEALKLRAAHTDLAERYRVAQKMLESSQERLLQATTARRAMRKTAAQGGLRLAQQEREIEKAERAFYESLGQVQRAQEAVTKAQEPAQRSALLQETLRKSLVELRDGFKVLGDHLDWEKTTGSRLLTNTPSLKTKTTSLTNTDPAGLKKALLDGRTEETLQAFLSDTTAARGAAVLRAAMAGEQVSPRALRAAVRQFDSYAQRLSPREAGVQKAFSVLHTEAVTFDTVKRGAAAKVQGWVQDLGRFFDPDGKRLGQFSERMHQLVKARELHADQTKVDMIELLRNTDPDQIPSVLTEYADSNLGLAHRRGMTIANQGQRTPWALAQEHFLGFRRGGGNASDNVGLNALFHMWAKYGQGALDVENKAEMLGEMWKALEKSTSFGQFSDELKEVYGKFGIEVDERAARSVQSGLMGVMYGKTMRDLEDQALQVMGSHLTAEQAASINSVLTRGAGSSPQQVDEALGFLSHFGMSHLENKAPFREAKYELVKLHEHVNGDSAYLPGALLKAVDASFQGLAKELEALPKVAGLGERVQRVLDAPLKFWKTSVVLGYFIPNPANILRNNILGDMWQMGMTEGPMVAGATTYRNLWSALPFFSKIQKYHVEKMDQGRLGSMLSAFLDPDSSRILHGKPGEIALAGQKYDLDEIRDMLVSEGIISSQADAELLHYASTAAGGSGILGMLGRHQKDIVGHAELAGRTTRVNLWLHLVRKGVPIPDATRRTLDAVFDWKHGVPFQETNFLMQHIPFFRYFYLSQRQAFRFALEPFVTPSGDYFKRALLSQTQFARVRDTETLVSELPNFMYDAFVDVEAENADIAERDRIGARHVPGWAKTGQLGFVLPDRTLERHWAAQGKERERWTYHASVDVAPVTVFHQQLAAMFGLITVATAGFNHNVALPADWWGQATESLTDQFGPTWDLLLHATGQSKESRTGQVKVRPNQEPMFRLLDTLPFIDMGFQRNERGQLQANALPALLAEWAPGLAQVPNYVAAVKNPEWERSWRAGFAQVFGHLLGVHREYAAGTFRDAEWGKYQADKMYKETLKKASRGRD